MVIPMRAALIAISLVLAACEAGVTSDRGPDGGRRQIDCSQSYLAVSMPGSYGCEQFARTAATNGERPGAGIFQDFNVFGSADDGTAISLQLQKSLSTGYYSPSVNPSYSYEGSIKGFGTPTVRGAQNWSALRSVGGARVMTFVDASQRQCFGLVEFGGLVRGGYDHVLRGYFCRPSSQRAPFEDEQIATLLGKVVVRDSLSSPLPAAMLPKPLLTCLLPDGSSFVTANEPGCVKRGGHMQPAG
jgi:hypothetical protein